MKRCFLLASALLLSTFPVASGAAAASWIANAPRLGFGIGHAQGAVRTLTRAHPVRPPSTMQFTIVDVPGAGTAAGQGTVVVSVNSSSYASGYYADGSGNTHGFVRAPDGTF